MWDPDQYRHFGDERSRPFFDLLARVATTDPAVVVDLGCGPGALTAELARRWPAAEVRGVDSSAQMIEAAQALPAASSGRLSFALGDVRDWEPGGRVDVIVSNAVLQWVPGHLQVLARWAGFLNEGGWLAVQVPGNFDQPSHAVLRGMVGSPRWRPLLADVQLNRSEASPAEFLEVLAGSGFEVDAWETTYLHVLHGENAVVDWYKGTGLRPVLAALPPSPAAEFLAEYTERIATVYPSAPYGTPFPFRRVFAVGHRPSHG
jgi:trans-aconitate 2-methyltransferase